MLYSRDENEKKSKERYVKDTTSSIYELIIDLVHISL